MELLGLQTLRARQPSEQLGVNVLLAADHDRVPDSIWAERLTMDDSRTVDRLWSEEAQPEVFAPYRDATEMVPTDQVDRCLHRVDSEWSGLLQSPDQEIKQLPQRRILVDKMKVDAL